MFKPIKVLVIDNNIVVRKMILEHLEGIAGVDVVSTANNGKSGVEKWRRYQPEIILCDLDLPGMDGYDMSMEILKDNKPVAIIVVSALNNDYATRVLEMISKGVADYILKPSDIAGGHSKQEFWRSLSELVTNHGAAIKQRRASPEELELALARETANVTNKSDPASTIKFSPPTRPEPTPPPPKHYTPPSANPTPTKAKTPTPPQATVSTPPTPMKKAQTLSQITSSKGKVCDIVKPTATLPPKLLVIGSSTGGPAALTIFLKELNKRRLRTDVPVFITQHMPPIFTARLADQLTKNTGCKVVEAKENMVIENGIFYLAPGDYHMHVGSSPDGDKNKKIIRLKQGPKVNFCRPAVDEMLDSIMTKYKSDQILTVILTGMGSDGKNSCVKLKQGGGTVFAQNEDTAAVWGMPGAVATANICSAISPLPELARQTVKYMKEARL